MPFWAFQEAELKPKIVKSRPTLQEVCSQSTMRTRWPYPYLPMQTHVRHQMSLTTLTFGALSRVLAFQKK